MNQALHRENSLNILQKISEQKSPNLIIAEIEYGQSELDVKIARSDLSPTAKLSLERSYTDDAIESLIEHLWQEMKEYIILDDYKSKGSVLVLEKEKPYPCNKGEFKYKDGIHLIFPDIILDKKAYKKIVASIVEKDKIKTIFDEGSEIEPDNLTNSILDSSFSSWQLYGCG